MRLSSRTSVAVRPSLACALTMSSTRWNELPRKTYHCTISIIIIIIIIVVVVVVIISLCMEHHAMRVQPARDLLGGHDVDLIEHHEAPLLRRDLIPIHPNAHQSFVCSTRSSPSGPMDDDN
jgi:hypothetical protein